MKPLLLFALLSLSAVAHAGPLPDQAARWQAARLDPKRTIELDKAVALYQRTAARNRAVSASGVPAVVVFCLHYREASNSFASSLAQGDPLTHRSIHVPKNRIPGRVPPYTWEECALDALALDRMGAKDWRTVAGTLNACEGYNGWGYWKRGLVSPYNFAGTDRYSRGKFSGDGRYDPLAVDQQLGVAAILLRMRERGISPPF